MRAKKFLTQRLIPSDRQRDYEALAASRPVANMDAFLQHCQRRRYPAKSTIIFAGEQGKSLYFMISGTVSVVLEDDEGREMIIAYINKNEFFGELGIFNEGDRNRSAQIRAKTDCEVALISYSKFLELWRVYPEVLFSIGSQIANRLKRTTRKVGDLAFMDVTGRVAGCLLELCKQPDAMTHPDGMQIKITRQEIGRIVGCSREMVGRVLKELEEQGLIEVHGKTMVIYGTR